MPVYRDPASGKRIRSDQPLSDAELEEAFGAAAPTESGGLGAAASYLGDRVKDVAGAAGRLVTPTGLGRREPDWNPQPLKDSATVLGAALAPGLTGAGALAGAGVKGLGGDDSTAALVDAATGLGGGVAHGIWRGGRRLATTYGQEPSRGYSALEKALAMPGAGTIGGLIAGGHPVAGLSAAAGSAAASFLARHPRAVTSGIRGLAGPTGHGIAAAGGRLASGGEPAAALTSSLASRMAGALTTPMTTTTTVPRVGFETPGPVPRDEMIRRYVEGNTSEEAPQAGRQPPGPTRRFARDIAWASTKTGVPVSLLRTVMHKESRGNPKAVSPQNARGLMQLLPSTFDGLAPRIEAITGQRADIGNPRDNILAGALYLREALDKNKGKVAAAARYYHGGPSLRQHGPKTAAYGSGILSDFLAAR